MSGYELYIFLLCLIVLLALSAFFSFLIYYIVKINLKLIRVGELDEEIKKEKKKEQKKKNKVSTVVFNYVIPALFLALFVFAFSFSLSVQFNEHKTVGDIPVLKVVTSESMAKKNSENKYLDENDLNDQVYKFDLISIEKLPNEDELKVYDVVVYEIDNILVIHRIYKIEIKDGVKLFTFRGDANAYSDIKPVLYSQMRGIYNGKRIPNIGSFVIFMQSPAGYICLMLMILVLIGYPFVERRLNKEANKRTLMNYSKFTFSKSLFSKTFINRYIKEVNGDISIKEGDDSTKTGLPLMDAYYLNDECIAFIGVNKENHLTIYFKGDEEQKRELGLINSKFPVWGQGKWLLATFDTENYDNVNKLKKVLNCFKDIKTKDQLLIDNENI